MIQQKVIYNLQEKARSEAAGFFPVRPVPGTLRGQNGKSVFWVYLVPDNSCCQLKHRPDPRPKRNAEEVEYEDQDDPGDQEADGVR